MTIRELFDQARQGLLTNRLRATLSVIGIVVGIATVVASLAIGEGARRSALNDIGALGIDNLFARAIASGADLKGLPIAPALTATDASAIERLPQVKGVASARFARGELDTTVRSESVAIAGVTTNWAFIANVDCARGRWLTAEDVRTARRVAVLGPDLEQTLAQAGNPVGRSINIDGQFFDVVGVLRATGRGAAAAVAQSFGLNRSIIVPISAMDRGIGMGDAIDRISEISVRAAPGSDVDRLAKSVSALLRTRHPDTSTPFELVVPRELLRARLRAQRTFDIVLVSTGCIALIIAGVGIMNVMLASVTERKREIGVRLAVGARPRDVVGQFTIEAGLLCLVGGVAGIPLGAIFAWAVSAFAGWPVAISAGGLGVALTLSASVGLAFGIYPAYLAASNDPVESLRA
jgi:putative ABC transport system permease protein